MVRKAAFPGTKLTGEANLLIMPNVEAANITYNLLKMIGGEGVTVGPFLLGAEKPVHILTPAATVRRIINMTAVASANARGACQRAVMLLLMVDSGAALRRLRTGKLRERHGSWIPWRFFICALLWRCLGATCDAS